MQGWRQPKDASANSGDVAKTLAGIWAKASRSIGSRDGEFGGLGQRRLGLARREHRKRVDGSASVLARALDRVVKRAAGLKQPYRLAQILVRHALAADRGAPES